MLALATLDFGILNFRRLKSSILAASPPCACMSWQLSLKMVVERLDGGWKLKEIIYGPDQPAYLKVGTISSPLTFEFFLLCLT